MENICKFVKKINFNVIMMNFTQDLIIKVKMLIQEKNNKIYLKTF